MTGKGLTGSPKGKECSDSESDGGREQTGFLFVSLHAREFQLWRSLGSQLHSLVNPGGSSSLLSRVAAPLRRHH